jgi:rhamnosyl/mannosyltransferase
MKILHVYRTYFPDSQGGLEEAIRQLCAATSDLGVENRIFTLSPQPHPVVLSRPEAEVHRFPRDFEIASCSCSLRCLAGFKQLVDWADIVHYQFPWPFADLLHFGAGVRKPTLITYQSDIVRQRCLLRLYQPLMHRFLASADAIVATSPQYAGSSPVLPLYRPKLQVIPIGLAQERYPVASSEQLAAVRRRYGSDYFLFVGVLRYYKGLHLLLEAARNAPFAVVIVGSGPMEGQLKQQAVSLGLTNVHFTGYVDDATKVALYGNARAIVFPSHRRSEAFGVTLVEGALFGKPLISAEIGSGTSYINQNLQTGLIVAPNDPAALRQAMLQLHQDPALARKFGDNAHQRYCQLFTAQQMAGSYHQLYLNLLG